MGASVSSKTFTPATHSDLAIALTQAKPGDMIKLLPIIYEGEFNLRQLQGEDPLSSTTEADLPITLIGSQSSSSHQCHTTIIAPNKGISITGGKWTVSSLSIESDSVGLEISGGGGHEITSLSINANKIGIVVNGDNNRISATTISNAEQGICIKGAENEIKSTTLWGIKQEGIQIQSESEGTSLSSVSVHMANPKALSFLLQNGTYDTTTHSSRFNGIASIHADHAAFAYTTFDGINCFGKENDFTTSTVQTLYEDKQSSNNIFEWPTGTIKMGAHHPLPFHEN